MNLPPAPHSYLSPKLVVGQRSGQFAVFAAQPVQPGELVCVWSGIIVNHERLTQLPDEIQRHTIQVEEGLYLASILPDEPADYINHSCEPNAGLSGQLALVAMRAIQPGEEVSFDYAMCDGSVYDEFLCECGAPNCRGRVAGDDWRNPALWDKYAGYFAPYLQRRIDALRHAAVDPARVNA